MNFCEILLPLNPFVNLGKLFFFEPRSYQDPPVLHDDDDDEEMAGLSEEEKAEKRIEKLKKLDKSLDMVRLWLLN